MSADFFCRKTIQIWILNFKIFFFDIWKNKLFPSFSVISYVSKEGISTDACFIFEIFNGANSCWLRCRVQVVASYVPDTFLLKFRSSVFLNCFYFLKPGNTFTWSVKFKFLQTLPMWNFIQICRFLWKFTESTRICLLHGYFPEINGCCLWHISVFDIE